MKNRFHKILSIILSVIMILSVCSVVAIAETGNVPSYYAINGGTGDGRSADTPAASVRAAVESAIADGYAAGDTVRVYIMQNEWTSTSELTYWADISVVGVMATHEFTLEVMPYDTSITTYLLFHNKANGNEYLVLGGPTVFDDITIVNDRNNWDSIALIGNSVTFRDGIKYGSIGTSYGSSVKTYSALMTTLGYYNKNHTVDRQVNLVFENAFVTSDNDIKNSAIILGAQGPETATYNEDVNITFNNSNISAYLNWGNINNNGGTYTFNKNINIDIKSATSITNDKLADAPVVNVAGAVQFIYDSKTNLNGDITSLTGVTVTGGVYTLKDRSSQDDFLTFTATAGTYAVKEGFTAYATDANGTTYTSENGLLTVPAGTYTVTEEPPQSSGEGGTTATVKDYFAINGGTGDGRRADAPAASVRAAVEAAIEDGLEVGDTANVYIMQKNWTSTSEFTYWADVSVAGVMATHEFTVEVKPYDTSITTYLLFHNKANANEYLVLGGPTVFDDITLVNDRQNWDAIALLGNSATFREGVKYASIGTSYGTSVKNYEGLVTVTGYYNKKHTVSDDFNLVFENAFKTADNDIKNSSIYLGGYGPETATYNVDANIVFNNPELSAYLNWGNMNANGSITYNKNVNIDIKAAAKLVNNQIYATTVNVTGGIQFIVANDTEFICDFTAYEYVTIGGGLYVLRKNTDVEDIITFTEKAGVYAVKEGYNVKATNANGDEFTSANGYITVPSGEYTITEYVPPVTYNYYVKNGGTGDGKTAETPAPTVYAAIETINADGLTANDTANIYIMQREDWNGTEDAVENNITSWATQANIVPPAHEAHIVVQAYDVTITTYLAAHDTLGYNEWLYISGPTTFKNITIVGLRSDYDGISLCGHDVTFGSGTKYGRISNYTSWDGVVDSPFPGLATSMSQGFVKNTYDAQTVVFENDFCGASANRALYINGNGACKATYTEDVNIVFNNSNIECAVYWGNGNVNGPTYFEKNLNVMVKNAKSINNTVGKASVDVAGALQLIVNSSTGWNGDVNTFENVTKGSYWYITNASGLGDILSFTATAGTYDVRTGYTAVATNDETGEEVTSADGSITLAAGKWTVAASKDPEVRNYYVINGGTGDGRSLSSPAATVYDAIVSINADGLIKGDTANVFIMQRSDWNASAGVMVGGSYGAVPHEITAWAVDGATPPTHSALLVVQAYDSNVDTYLTYSDKLGQNTFLVLAGPTVFQNIRLVSQRGYYTQMELAGNSVTFGEGTKYGKIDNDEYAGTASAWNGKVNSYDALATSTGTYSKKATVNEVVNVVFENGYASANKNSSVYIDTTGISTNVYNEDYNIIINNKNAAPTVYLGNAGSAGSSTFNKNLNFVVRDATGLTLAESNNPVTVNGAMQILVNAGAAYTGNVASFANVSVAGGIWTVKVISAVADALSLTDTVGVYNVAEGYIAIATDVNGNKFYSENGLLNLAAAGEYTVETISDYTNDGETITVYKDCVIDISVVEHTVKDGKVFLGWMDADGEYVPRKAKYYEGDILTASYIDFNESDFAIEQTQIRTEGDLGLRFVVNQNKGALALLPEIVESGAIVLPTDLAGGRDIYLDTPVVLTWKWDDVDKNSFSPDTTGYTPSSVLADNILEESQTNLKYTLCVTGIEEDKYNVFYTARGYLTYVDYNDIEHTIYTDDAQDSLYKLAAEAIAAGETDNVYTDIVDYVENVWNVEYRADLYSEVTYYSGYETTADTNPNHKIYSLKNGIYVRDVTVNSGFNIESTEICFITDPHFNYINEIDIQNKSINALSSYRGRTWLRDGSSITKANQIMQFAQTFKKTVLGGDAVDYLSEGSLSVTENLFTKKSVNGSILMAFGNHETEETMQADVNGLVYKMSLEERYKKVANAWANDPKYHEEIMTDANGNPNVMLVVLDNSQAGYWESQIDMLRTSIAEARELSIPIILFQHIPMLTWNPNETEVYIASGPNPVKYFATGSAGEESLDVRDMTSFYGYMGANTDDTVTQEICRIIRQSSDVIKAVIDGHEHANMYTEIVAIDEEGNTLYDADGNMIVIPQHTGYGSHYNGVMKITVN